MLRMKQFDLCILPGFNMLRLFEHMRDDYCQRPTDSGIRYPIRGWKMWLAPRAQDSVAVVLYIVGVIAYIYCMLLGDVFKHPNWYTGLPSLSLILLFIIADRAEFYRYGTQTPRNVAIASVLIRMVLIEVITFFDVLYLGSYLHITLMFQAFFYIGSLAGYMVSVFVVADTIIELFTYDPGWYADPDLVHNLMLLFFVVLLFNAMAEMFKREVESRRKVERLYEELEASNRQLTLYSQQVAVLAATEERNRLARDIHDSLGHYLTVVNVQLEKALAFREKAPEEALKSVIDAKRLASEALSDVRNSMSALRNTDQTFNLQIALEKLVANVCAIGCNVELQFRGQEDHFPNTQLYALFRAAQEGLTNIQKHANASAVMLQVCLKDDHALLELVDDGEGFDTTSLEELASNPDRSFGLQGVQERMEIVRGSLSIDSEPGQGTTLRVTVPRAAQPSIGQMRLQMA